MVVAVTFTFVLPEQVANAEGLRHSLLHWGHALVWLLLALFCFAWGAGLLGVAAGLLLTAFLVALVVR